MYEDIETHSTIYGYHFQLYAFNNYMVYYLSKLVESSTPRWYELEIMLQQFQMQKACQGHNTYLVDNLHKLHQLITADACNKHHIHDLSLIRRMVTILNFCVKSNLRSD